MRININNILNYVPSYKSGGGIVKFLNPSGRILYANNHGLNDWHDLIFSGFKNTLLNKIKSSTNIRTLINQINNYLLSYKRFFSNGNFSENPNIAEHAAYQRDLHGFLPDINNVSIANHYNGSGRYLIDTSRIGNSNYNPEGNWSPDGNWLALTNDLAVLGASAAWDDNNLTAFNNILKDLGIEAYRDEADQGKDNSVILLRLLNDNNTDDNLDNNKTTNGLKNPIDNTTPNLLLYDFSSVKTPKNPTDLLIREPVRQLTMLGRNLKTLGLQRNNELNIKTPLKTPVLKYDKVFNLDLSAYNKAIADNYNLAATEGLSSNLENSSKNMMNAMATNAKLLSLLNQDINTQYNKELLDALTITNENEQSRVTKGDENRASLINKYNADIIANNTFLEKSNSEINATSDALGKVIGEYLNMLNHNKNVENYLNTYSDLTKLQQDLTLNKDALLSHVNDFEGELANPVLLDIYNDIFKRNIFGNDEWFIKEGREGNYGSDKESRRQWILNQLSLESPKFKGYLKKYNNYISNINSSYNQDLANLNSKLDLSRLRMLNLKYGNDYRIYKTGSKIEKIKKDNRNDIYRTEELAKKRRDDAYNKSLELARKLLDRDLKSLDERAVLFLKKMFS